MMHLHIPHLQHSLPNDALLDCGWTPHCTPEDPYFLTRVDFQHNDKNEADLASENKTLAHSKQIGYHHVINKVSLRREKEKTSTKPSTSTRCSISQVKLQQQPQGTGNMEAKGYQYPQARFFDYGRALTQDCYFSALRLRQNHKYYAQYQPSQKRQPYPCSLDTQHRYQIHPTIKFTVSEPHSVLAHSQSQKIIPSQKTQCINKVNQERQGINMYSAEKIHPEMEENAQPNERCSPLRKKELKTKKSYETHCSQSSLIKQHAQYTQHQHSQFFGSHIAKSQKSSLKRAEKGHKRFNTMSSLQEVKSVVDESQLSSEQESIVLVRLHQSNGTGLFDQFYDLRDVPFAGRSLPSKEF